MDIIQIATHLIDEDKEQPRYQFDEQSLQELMSSIEELGLLSPIKVRTTDDGRYKIIYGNRRYKASMMLGRKTIPCIVSTVTDELEIYLEQIAENLTREGFSPIEEAEAYEFLIKKIPQIISNSSNSSFKTLNITMAISSFPDWLLWHYEHELLRSIYFYNGIDKGINKAIKYMEDIFENSP